MPNVSEKKKKLLCLLQILLSETDSEHTLTLPELLQRLESMGVPAERKSIYDDIETLRSAGVKIGTRKRKTYQYFLESRTFSAAELQLIAGALKTSPFVSEKQAEALLPKLEVLCSSYQAEALKQEIFAKREPAPLEEAVPETVKLLCRAISENKKVRFTLREWRLTPQGKPEYAAKDEAKPVSVSPQKLFAGQGRCALLALDEEQRELCLPLEKLEGLELLSEERDTPKASVPEKQSKKTEKIVLEFSLDRLSVVAERFGSDFTVESAGKNRMRAALKGDIDPEFFVWLFSHGPDVRLLAPKKAVEQFREKAKSLAKLYKS